MDVHNSVSKSQKTNIIVMAGNDETLQNLLSIIQKSTNSGELADLTRHVIIESNENETKVSCIRRKADLTCMICEDKCSGYNFKVISCGSCKSFFQRNASNNVNDLKCLTNTNKCNIKFTNRRRICRRCRLEKCLTVGMKWNSSANEEKLNKQRQLEENRRSTKNVSTTLTQTSFTDVSPQENEYLMDESITNSTTDQLQIAQVFTDQQAMLPIQSLFLTHDDYDRINLVKFSNEKAFRLTTGKRDVSAFDQIIDQRSALLYSMSVSYDMGIQLMTFIRNIPEFESLHEHDRFILFKYNSPLVFFMHLCLNYDANRDLVFDPEVESEEYAAACKQLTSFCYGEQLYLQFYQLLRSIKKIADNDPIIMQLMTIILMFTRSVSDEDILASQELILKNSKQVFEAQSIYTDLLFRYMMEKYTIYQQVVRQYSQLIQKTIQMQMLAQNYQKFLQEQLVSTRDEEINPIMKSILRLH
ncbi:hypothetical protein I4U23_004694 [Adineta vaga]|nr:hypothetical protein I4U23_004694 [Adineta vaga]